MKITMSENMDKPAILNIHKQAFGTKKGIEISQLVSNLFDDISAIPRYSFIALENDTAIGHILFTKASIRGASEELSAQILAPLAILPEHQNKNIGSQLIHAGIDELRRSGVKIVFVLGHPSYYPRCGFVPAGRFGLEAPYLIPIEHSDAWMVQELYPGILGTEKGKVLCADALNKPEHWRE